MKLTMDPNSNPTLSMSVGQVKDVQYHPEASRIIERLGPPSAIAICDNITEYCWFGKKTIYSEYTEDLHLTIAKLTNGTFCFSLSVNNTRLTQDYEDDRFHFLLKDLEELLHVDLDRAVACFVKINQT